MSLTVLVKRTTDRRVRHIMANGIRVETITLQSPNDDLPFWTTQDGFDFPSPASAQQHVMGIML